MTSRKSACGLAAVLASSVGLTPAVSQAEVIYGLTNLSELVTFDSVGRTVTSSVAITGASIISIDVRPATGQLYGLSSSNQLYVINPTTGVSTAVGVPLTPSPGSSASIDFNPVVDRIRVVNPADLNLRVNPETGVAITDGTLAYAGGTPNPNIVDITYVNNTNGATTTTLYGYDQGTNRIVTISPPNAGTVNPIPNGVVLPFAPGFNSFTGLDTSGLTGITYLSNPTIGANAADTLYSIDLATGTAITLGTVNVNGQLRDITVFSAIPEPTSLALLGLGGLGLLRRRRA